MKYMATMAIAIATANAQMKEYDSLFRQFGNCMGSEFGSTQACDSIERYGAQCCDFEVVQDPSITGQFCITDGQRVTEFEGTYRDYDYTLWKWQCKVPEDSGPNDKSNTGDAVELSVYSNYEDKIMEWVLWVVYLSQEVYLLGYLVSVPMGFYLIWLQLVSMWQLFEIFGGKGDFGGWFLGPFLSYWIVQPFIYISSLVLGLIPGVNFISAFLFGWWANLDYYQYNYALFAGPTVPMSSS